jgi:hypothetical protein
MGTGLLAQVGTETRPPQLGDKISELIFRSG